MKRPVVFLVTCLLAMPSPTVAQPAPAPKTTQPAEETPPGNRMLADYFRAETAALAERCLADIQSLDDWKAKRKEYRRQLQEMLGLWPMPERTDLKSVVTGTLEHDEFTVEKLHFQASPRLYVTANLYVPKGLTNRVPAILYVCGHSTQVTSGVSVGNKAGYQHHGAWFARNGYVCLTIDTLQLGEIQGLHHGTHRLGQWWWNARGYTPAGVEAWFGIRALDYLCSRPEVDAARIGMTGRSGGGSYSWTVAALDERVKVVVPVAGITDMQNQVVDGCVEGHCDCMFHVNTHRWDFPLVAALIAPRPLLFSNSDKDKIFPLDGVVRTHEKVRRIYQLYGKPAHLGLLITEGPHADTQDLQVPAFRWFNRWLKDESPLIEMAAAKFFQPAQLKVFDTLPADEINTKIQESFGFPAAAPNAMKPETVPAALRGKVFAGWPVEDSPPKPELQDRSGDSGLRVQTYRFASQPNIGLPLYVLQDSTVKRPQRVALSVLDEAGWTNLQAAVPALGGGPSGTALEDLRREMQAGKLALAFVAPRGIGPTAWAGDAKQQTHIRRRFMLLGQTLDGMRVWDIRRATQALRSLSEFKGRPIEVRASGPMGVNALYAGLFEPDIARLDLADLPKSHLEGPDYLNVLQILDIPQALELAGRRVSAR
jgi:dienelactone hydrolase